MFTKKQTILFFEEGKISVLKVILKKKPVVKKLVEFEWKFETLEGVLKKIKKRIGKKTRILLSDQYVYTASIELPEKVQANEYEFVHHKVHEIVPEDLTKTAWDYQVILQVKKQEDQEGVRIAQVIVIVQSMFETLYTAFTKVKFNVEAIEAVSQSLMRLMHDPNTTTLLVYIQPKPLFVLLHKSLIVSTFTSHDVITPQIVAQVIAFNKTTYNIIPQKIVFTGAQASFDTQQLATKECAVSTESLDPSVGLAAKTIRKDTKQFLNLTLNRLVSTTRDIEKEEQSGTTQHAPEGPTDIEISEAKSSQRKTLWGIIGIILSLVVLGGVFFYQNGQIADETKKSKPVPIVQATPQVTPHNSPSGIQATESAKVALDAYTIAIFNGSGREGEAGTLRDILVSEGYDVKNTSNADSYEYTDSEVRYKQKIEAGFREVLDTSMKRIYPTKTGQDLPDDSETDVVITIGQSQLSQ